MIENLKLDDSVESMVISTKTHIISIEKIKKEEVKHEEPKVEIKKWKGVFVKCGCGGHYYSHQKNRHLQTYLHQNHVHKKN